MEKKNGYINQQWYEGWQNSLFNTFDDGFALVGTNNPPEGYNYGHSFLMKYNQDGDSLWTRHYQLENSYNVGLHGIQTNDGGYAICGGRKVFTDSSMTDTYEAEALLIKADSTGNMQWYNVYGHNGYEQVNTVVQTTDGGYMLGGRTANSYSSSYDWYLVKTDSLGNEEWYDTFGGVYDEFEIKGMIGSHDGNVLVIGQRTLYYNSSTSFKENVARILKINNAGSIVFDKEYSIYYDLSEPLDSNDCTLKGVTELTDNRIAVIGSYRYHEPNYSIATYRSIMFMLDENGDSLWTRRFSLPQYEGYKYGLHLYDIEQTSDNGFVLAGYAGFLELEPSQVPILVKTDSHGDDGTFIRSIEIENVNVDVYPNPCNGRFSIYLQNNDIQPAEYRYFVSNLLGQSVDTGTFPNKELKEIDISFCKSGIYLVSITNNSSLVYATKVIKR